MDQERINIFHKGRRMWAYVQGTLLVGPRHDPRTHEQWFRELGFTESRVWRVTRGFVLGDAMYAYIGELMLDTPTVRDEALFVVQELDMLLRSSKSPLRLFCGMRAGKPGELWTPTVELDRTKGGMPIESKDTA